MPQNFFQPPSIAQPKQYADFGQTLDSVFNQAMQARLAEAALQKQQFELSQAKGQAALQAAVLGFDPSQVTPAQLQAAQQPPIQNSVMAQPQVQQGQQFSTGQLPPGGGVLAPQQQPQQAQPQEHPIVGHIRSYVQRMQGMMGLQAQGAQADVNLKQSQSENQYAQALKELAISRGVDAFNGVGNAPGVSAGPPGVRQFTSPQGATVNAQMNPTTGQVTSEPAPGSVPPPESVKEANDLLKAQALSNQLFSAYKTLAAKGNVGKLAGTWDEAKGQFTGGASSPEALAFKNAAEGLVGMLRDPAGVTRLNPEIMGRLQNILANPKTSPEAAEMTHNLINEGFDRSLLVHSASYPQESVRIQRVKDALGKTASQTSRAPAPATQPQQTIRRSGRLPGMKQSAPLISLDGGQTYQLDTASGK